jgi:predicted ribosome quality control (RQC) complex YloA/Tae2 family protein
VQPVDFTTLVATCTELREGWLPARLEQVYQRDRHTLALALRTLDGRSWLDICWHPQAAHLCISTPPPRQPDTFTFSQQLKHQLGNLALTAIALIHPWERVVDFQFAKRPGDPVLWHVYVEIMGKYSNVILTNAANQIVTAAHQVSAQQSSVRPIQTGQRYEMPPRMLTTPPSHSESFDDWRDRLSLVTRSFKRNVLSVYSGLSSSLVLSMLEAAEIPADAQTDHLTDAEWQRLYDRWQEWLTALQNHQFEPGWRSLGYTVLGWGVVQPEKSVQTLLHRYYNDQRDRQTFQQLHHQLTQRLTVLQKKLRQKVEEFQSRLEQSNDADRFRMQADLLMAYGQQWQPGMTNIMLPDFATGEPVTIPLNPEKNAVQNAQWFYKRHQKLKRSRNAIAPLLADAQAELTYLEQVDVAIAQLDEYQTPSDLSALEDIFEELVQQGYLHVPERRDRSTPTHSQDIAHRYRSPAGHDVWVGRNNRQNDDLTFRIANDYDIWFHTQEIPGSHVLLRLEPGTVADDADLQFAANLAAYHSRARQSDQAPVVYTAPKHVYKPKGAKPGTVIYKQETVIWGYPQQVKLDAIAPSSSPSAQN